MNLIRTKEKNNKMLSQRPTHVFISSIHWVDKTIKCVTNNPAVAHKSWMVRCSPRTPGFLESKKHTRNIHPHVFNSFHRTILHRVSHRVFTFPSISNDISPHSKIETLPYVSYPLFLHSNPQKNWKVDSYPPLLENDSSPPALNFNLLTIRPLIQWSQLHLNHYLTNINSL